MHFLTTVLIFVSVVILGTIFSNKFQRIPAALFQIIFGALLVYSPIPVDFNFNSETFLLFVVAPLLYNDAYKSSRTNLWVYRKPILLMAVGLVLFSVVIVGSVIYFLIPAMPWATCFALAAILSPTDAIAVKSIVRGAKLPKGLMPILEGESLLNDAAGLVSFNIALGAILTNTFSLTKAAQDFTLVSLGGAALGLMFGVILVFIKKFIGLLVGDESNVLVIFQMITPIFIYYVAEYLTVSGIVAVVVTGFVYNLEKDLYQHDSLDSKTSLLIDASQDTLCYVLNGCVFVMLGYILPEAFIDIMRKTELNIGLLTLYILFTTLALMLTRFVYVYVFYNSFQAHTFTSTKKIIKTFIQRKKDTEGYSRFRYSLIAALGGIHGTVTMAAGLLIPVYLSSGELFPLRSTILYIASGVVLLSILIGIIFIPLALKKEDQEEYLEIRSIRERIINQAVSKLKKHYHDGSNVKRQIATAIVIKNLQAQQVMVSKNPNYLHREIHRIHKDVLHAENAQIKKWKEEHNLSKATIAVIQLMQLRRTKLLNYSVLQQIILMVKINFKANYFKRLGAKSYLKGRFSKADPMVLRQKLYEEVEHVRCLLPEIQSHINLIALEHIESMRNSKNSLAADIVSDVYKNFAVTYFSIFVLDESYEEELKEIKAEAIQIQKDKVTYLKKSNQISIEDGNTILKELNYNESLIFAEE
ncbi:cation:proton antiporter [Actinomyces sp. zg-332]|uniref:cation:proton antiporter domain-containing protein n=1 Tax=Actinomyces sp. zg-332 TaxID=2708340 RepID=UPI0014225084|nr:cation:proton antiporter [Actinomyces sp. zg-332]QPK94212.1 cation:proton antiporter [Actinomyces sp. zg-332]